MLGLVQGLTEFLPISSSAHLVFFQALLDVEGPALFYDLLLHFGTLLSILVYFRADFLSPARSLRERLRSGMRGTQGPKTPWLQDERLRMWSLVLVGSVPTFFIALLLHLPAEKAFRSVRLSATALLLTGLLLALTRRVRKEGKGLSMITVRDALVIGTAQGLAVFPGISRSGITIAAGLMMGLGGGVAARFSFLLSVPAILGAIAFQVLEQNGIDGDRIAVALTGSAVAFLSGLLAIRSVIGVVSIGRLHLFSYYCIPVGIAALALYWIF